MPAIIVLLGLGVSFALCCQCVNQNRAILNLLCFTKGSNQRARVMAIHVADVLEAKLIDKRAGQHRGSDSIFHRLGSMVKTPTNRRNRQEGFLNFIFEAMVTAGTANSV